MNDFWEKYVTGSMDDKGNTQKGILPSIIDTGISGFNAYQQYLALKETKKQNAHIREYNKTNSVNTAKAYNANLEDRTNARMTASGHNSELDAYLRSKEYNDKKAISL